MQECSREDKKQWKRQRRIIEEKIREAVKESESRCDQSCARRLEVTSKAARVLITEAMQTAITQAEKTSRSFTQEQNTIRQRKMIRKLREMEESETARDKMESKCMDAAKSCCEAIVMRQSEIQGERMDVISEPVEIRNSSCRVCKRGGNEKS